jgi:hypothetical protein
MADFRQRVALSLIAEFENFQVFKPSEYNLPALNAMPDQEPVTWSAAPAPVQIRRRALRLICPVRRKGGHSGL